MGLKHHHYDHAFEEYLRKRRVPYVSVDEARKALLPERGTPRAPRHLAGSERAMTSLKSFDFVVYGALVNRLVEVKGRKVTSRASGAPGTGRLESWVTLEDIESLATWQSLFGAGFEACLVFLYWCDAQPPDGLYQEIFSHQHRWYAMRSVLVNDYRKHMKVRSARWGTVDLPTDVFRAISEPFQPSRAGLQGGERGLCCRGLLAD